MMKKLTALLLALVLLLAVCACGNGSSNNTPADNSGSPVLPENPIAEPIPSEPTVEPYEIMDPTVMPEGGVRDGVTYTAWDGIVEHLFFHPVIAYPELAFDGDYKEQGLDDWMVTVTEFDRILQSLYDRGYVLVDINDVWSETTTRAARSGCSATHCTFPKGRSP